MKKVISLAIVMMLALSCMFTAFAQTADSASPDEAKKVAELKITKLPTKLTYTEEDAKEPAIEYDKIFEDDVTPEALIEYMKQFNLELNLDLTGMELEAVYNDGTTEKVDVKDCKAELADPFNYGEVIEEVFNYNKKLEEISEDITEEEFFKLLQEAQQYIFSLIYREYTVNVSYQDAQASYKVMLEYLDDPFDPVEPDYNARYEVVSVKAPEKVSYTKADLENFADEDEEPSYGFAPDYEGMEVVVKDTVTGKTYTLKFDGTEDIYVDDVYVDFPNDKDQKFKVDCSADVNELLGLDEDEDYDTYIDFTFVVKYNETKSSVKPSSNASSSTSDTATKDTANKTTGNGTVQTGSPITTALFLTAAIIAGGALFISYRKKFEK